MDLKTSFLNWQPLCLSLNMLDACIFLIVLQSCHSVTTAGIRTGAGPCHSGTRETNPQHTPVTRGHDHPWWADPPWIFDGSPGYRSRWTIYGASPDSVLWHLNNWQSWGELHMCLNKWHMNSTTNRRRISMRQQDRWDVALSMITIQELTHNQILPHPHTWILCLHSRRGRGSRYPLLIIPDHKDDRPTAKGTTTNAGKPPSINSLLPDSVGTEFSNKHCKILVFEISSQYESGTWKHETLFTED